MSYFQQDFQPAAEWDNETSQAVSTGPISDAQRYEWIRAHRGDFAITRALECSDFDHDFDRQIDAAIHSSRMGMHHHLEASWWDAPRHPHRRRDDE